jgi:hypothetical protein
LLMGMSNGCNHKLSLPKLCDAQIAVALTLALATGIRMPAINTFQIL